VVSIAALWLPILLSAVFVFIASSLLHMLIPIHHGDFKTLPREDEVMDALRPFDVPPGDYMMPRPPSMGAMREPAFKAKYKAGPVAIMTFYNSGMNVGGSLVQWFVYLLFVGVLCAMIAGPARGPGAGFRAAFHFSAMTAFCCYWVASIQQSVWYKRSWGVTLLYGFDALVYAIITGATFGWLWPK
jgi:hypothetical protein